MTTAGKNRFEMTTDAYITNPEDCPESEVLHSYLLGRLPGDEFEIVDSHVSSCSTCSLAITRSPAGADQLTTQLSRLPSDSDFGDYELILRLGRGGMGQVYKARHRVLGQDFALKIIHPELQSDSHFVARFEREIRSLGKLNSPHIVQSVHAGQWQGTSFVVMELIDGSDLQSVIREYGLLNSADAAEAIAQIAEGLEAIHSLGLVHRDLHPGNALLSRDGRVKISDLGLVTSVEPIDEPPGLTDARDRLGAESFMAPEQRLRPDAVTPSADMFSLGCVWYYLLTGRALSRDPLTHQVTRIDASLKAIPRSCRSLLSHLLSNDSEERPSSASLVAKKLAPIRRKADLAKRFRPPDTHRLRRKPFIIAASLVFLAALSVIASPLLRWSESSNVSDETSTGSSLEQDVVNSKATVISPGLDSVSESLGTAPLVDRFQSIASHGRLLPPRPMATATSSGEFEETGQELFGGKTPDVALADLDGDDDLDAFFVSADEMGCQVWLNDGRAFFTDTQQRLGRTSNREVALGDLDGDGDFDAVVASISELASQVWINDGDARFHRNESASLPASDHVTLGDIDNDGHLDALFSTEYGPMVALGDGEGTLITDGGHAIAVKSGATTSLLSRPALGDLDADGDLDIFLSHMVVTNGEGRPAEVWFNDGRGRFHYAGDHFGTDVKSCYLQVVADVDNDGDLDAVETTGAGPPGRLWLNDGDGSFRSGACYWGATFPQAAEFADFDGDGRTDVLLSYSNLSGGLQLIRDTSNAPQDSRLEYFGIKQNCYQLAIGDLDGDGDLDGITVGRSWQSGRVWLNRNNSKESRFEQRSVFDPKPITLAGLPSYRLLAADLNGDRAPELCFNVLREPQGFQRWKNDGAGAMTREPKSFLNEQVIDGVVTDFDADGDSDLAIVTFSMKCLLMENNGRGDFQVREPVTGLVDIFGIGAGDFDADDDVDLILGTKHNGTTLLLRNDGIGNFVAEPTAVVPSTNNYVSRIGVHDLDGDSDLDLIIVTGSISLWFNDGTGVFKETRQPIGKSKGNAAVFEDFNGDGHRDLLLAEHLPPQRILLGKGDGTFEESRLASCGVNAFGVAAGDIDQDGDLDIVYSSAGSAFATPSTVWFNEGDGTLYPRPQLLNGLGAFDAKLIDLDDDTDLDLVFSNVSSGSHQIFFNTTVDASDSRQ